MRRIVKTQSPEPECAFRLHYFPNIPVGGETVVCGRTGESNTFRRLNQGESETSQTDAASAASGHAEPEDDERLSEIEAEAYRAGFAKGEAEGREAGRLAAQPLVETLEGVLQEIDGFRKRLRQHTEHETVRLALAVAKKILVREVSVSDSVILNVVREALRQTDEPDKVLIRLHPEDLAVVERESGSLIELSGRSEMITFEPDAAISRGGCFVETEFGEIDARIEQQFRVVEDAFQAEMLLIDPIEPDETS